METTITMTISVNGRHMMWRDDLADGRHGDAQGCPEQQERDDGRRQGFGPAVTIRIVVIGGTRSDPESAPYDQRREDIGGRLDGVRDQGVGVPCDSRQEFADHQRNVDKQPDQGGSHPTGGLAQSSIPHSPLKTALSS